MIPKPGPQKLSLIFSYHSLILLLVLLFYFSACSDDNDFKKCLLTKSSATYPDGSKEEWTLTYNSDDRLYKWSSLFTSENNDTYTYHFENTYDLNGNVIMETYDDGHAAYSYNSLNQVIKEEYYDGNVLKATIENEYNTSGQIIKRQHYTVNGTDSTPDYYSLIEYATSTTKNVQRSTRFNQDDTLHSKIEYQYDNKINPWTQMGLTGLYAHGENNITKEIRTEGATVNTYTYSYEYTADGYPTKMNYESSSGLKYTEVYTYDCK